jgi:hypothetical protein
MDAAVGSNFVDKDAATRGLELPRHGVRSAHGDVLATRRRQRRGGGLLLRITDHTTITACGGV